MQTPGARAAAAAPGSSQHAGLPSFGTEEHKSWYFIITGAPWGVQENAVQWYPLALKRKTPPPLPEVPLMWESKIMCFPPTLKPCPAVPVAYGLGWLNF